MTHQLSSSNRVLLAAAAMVCIGCGDFGRENASALPDPADPLAAVRLDIGAILGPLVGGFVSVRLLEQPDLEIVAGVTLDAPLLTDAGRVSLDVPQEYKEKPLLIKIAGGQNVDADDDGRRDASPVPNTAELEFVVSSAAELSGFRINLNPLLLIATRYVRDNLWSSASISPNYTAPATGEQIRSLQDKIARALLNNDVNGDGHIDWKDLLSFHSLTDQAKSNMPWGSVLTELQRTQERYFARATIQYSNWYVINPNTLAASRSAFVVSMPGDVSPPNRVNHAKVLFTTNKNNYRIRDADWQQNDPSYAAGFGPHIAGAAAVPTTLIAMEFGSKVWGCFTGKAKSTSNPSLNLPDCYVGTDADEPLQIAVGGVILGPTQVPAGSYTVSYRTNDGRNHEESVYVYENAQETVFEVRPVFALDSSGRIASLHLEFSRNGIGIADDVPAIWAEASMVCSTAFRGEGFYSLTGERDFWTTFPEGVCFRQVIDLLAATDSIIPSSNDKQIVFEDVTEFRFAFHTGDGVQRIFRFDPKGSGHYPQMRTSWDSVKGAVTILPYAANVEQVTGFRYRWFDRNLKALGEWVEVLGDTATVTPPPEAYRVVYTAKGKANFYYLGYEVFWRPFNS